MLVGENMTLPLLFPQKDASYFHTLPGPPRPGPPGPRALSCESERDSAVADLEGRCIAATEERRRDGGEAEDARPSLDDHRHCLAASRRCDVAQPMPQRARQE